jgi:hypothetical protein
MDDLSTRTDPTPSIDDPWTPLATATHARVIVDHEQNPEYELHVGRPIRTENEVRRYVSVWLRGVRYYGWLVAGEPVDGDGPDQAP